MERTFAALNERISAANAAGSGWPSREETEAAERQRADSNNNILAYNNAVPAAEQDQARFNEAVQSYNTAIKRFPAALLAGMFGHSPRPYFTATPGSDRPPEVKFDFNQPDDTGDWQVQAFYDGDDTHLASQSVVRDFVVFDNS